MNIGARALRAQTCALGVTLICAVTAAHAANPDFDNVNWIAQCSNELQGDQTPGTIDIVGNATFPATYIGQDGSYIYFRYRLDLSPTGPGGFAQNAWVVLLNVPSGNPFRYQYLLSLNGKGDPDDFGNSGDNIEIWSNNPATAEDIDFSPIFNDPADARLYAQKFDFASGGTVNTTSLARIVDPAPGSSFGATADAFLEVAYPISVLISKGVIASAGDLADVRYFMATSANENNFNKDAACQFVPQTTLGITKSVAPSSIPVNDTTPIDYTIIVTNTGNSNATGVVIDDSTLPSYMTSIDVTVSSSSMSVSWTVVSTNPLQVKVPTLPPGTSVTVHITADASPECNDANFTNTAKATAINAVETSTTALLTITKNAPETCNGIDDDCDGSVDEGGNALCDNHNLCDGSETCGGASGCLPGTPVVCAPLDQCHDAGVCQPGTGLCTNPTKQNGASCDDGNACTQTDTCQSGTCTGGNPVVCQPLDQCHDAGTCNMATGMCSNPAKQNGEGCNDGDACTDGDTCQGGACSPGTPTVCVAQDQCHVAGTCDPGTGVCSNPNAQDDSPCNDGNACTQTDTCQGGVCEGANPKTCTALDDCHQVGVCNPATGTCSNPNAPDGTACDNPGNLCLQTHQCVAGVCTGSDPIECPPTDQCHTQGTCDTTTGTCSNPKKPDDSACDDTNACTQTDTCQDGVCTGMDEVECTPKDQCHIAGTCDPNTGNCSEPTKGDGTSCDDNDECTQSDTCQAGVCVGDSPIVCTALDQCHDPGSCDSTSGECSNPPKQDNTACSDNDACTQNDICLAGVCQPGTSVVCVVLDQCHLLGKCDSQTGSCSNPIKDNDTLCDDNDACTQTDVCLSGTCQGTDPVVCKPLDACHAAGACDPNSGDCTDPTGPDGVLCDDNDECTLGETCLNGDCTNGTPKVCDDGNPCTTDDCEPTSVGGCFVVPNDNPPCSDGNACTTDDHCDGGICQGGGAVLDCNDNEPCTSDQCDNAQSGCYHVDLQLDCTDNDNCTDGDKCQVGKCQPGPPKTCNDNEPCTDDACVSPGGCVYTPDNTNECDDNDNCTKPDACVNGSCHGTPVDCVDNNPCTLDSCDDQGGDFLCLNDDCRQLPGTPCPDDCPEPPPCGNHHIDPGETCDPPNPALDPVTHQVICRDDCTSCGDGVVDDGSALPGHSDHADGEGCDDMKAHADQDGFCKGLMPIDQCRNACVGNVCEDPALIKFRRPFHQFKFHAQLVTDASIDFVNNHFVAELRDANGNVLFRSSLLAASLVAKTENNFYFKNTAARVEGGAYKLRLKRGRYSYRVYLIAYGDLSLSVADMVTYVYSGTNAWAVRGIWTPIIDGWRLNGKSTFLTVP